MSIEDFDNYFKEGRKIVTVKDVEPEKFISAFSQHLKRQGRFELPKWADVVKTSKAKELPPSDPEGLWVPAAPGNLHQRFHQEFRKDCALHSAAAGGDGAGGE